jgi:hypothetical protein
MDTQRSSAARSAERRSASTERPDEGDKVLVLAAPATD